MEEFNEWEKGVKEQQRQLIEERNSLIAPQDLDTTLGAFCYSVLLYKASRYVFHFILFWIKFTVSCYISRNYLY